MSPDAQWKWFAAAVALSVVAAVLPQTTKAKWWPTALAAALAVTVFVFAYDAWQLAHP